MRRDGRRGSTLARKVAAVRSFYRWAQREGLTERDIVSLLDAPKAGRYLPDVLPVEDVARILEAAGDDDIGLRDRAALELLYASGLRVSELVQTLRNRQSSLCACSRVITAPSGRAAAALSRSRFGSREDPSALMPSSRC